MIILAVWFIAMSLIIWADRRAIQRDRLERVKYKVLTECLTTRQHDAMISTPTPRRHPK